MSGYKPWDPFRWFYDDDYEEEDFWDQVDDARDRIKEDRNET